MNAYEQKQEARRQRLERAAERATKEAESAFKRSRSYTDGIPLGQPILISHHSEKRHRNALKKSDNAMRKACESTDAAKEYASRAASVGTGGISSDDPDAVVKLKAELDAMTTKRDRMKAMNTYWRKYHTMKGFPGMSDDAAARIDAEMPNRMTWEQKGPARPYEFTNLGANIRRVEQRIKDLSKRQEIVAAVETGAVEAPAPKVIGKATITRDFADNRVLIQFPARLSREQYKAMRSCGFVWSPSRTAFVRKLTGNAIYSADSAAKAVAALEPPQETPQAATAPDNCGCPRIEVRRGQWETSHQKATCSLSDQGWA